VTQSLKRFCNNPLPERASARATKGDAGVPRGSDGDGMNMSRWLRAAMAEAPGPVMARSLSALKLGVDDDLRRNGAKATIRLPNQRNSRGITHENDAGSDRRSSFNVVRDVGGECRRRRWC